MLLAAQPALAGAPADAYAIFATARAYWNDAAYPQHVSYDIVVRVSAHGTDDTAHYHAFYDAVTDQPQADAVSDEERAHPYTPHGVKTLLSLFGATIPTSTAEYTHDYLGVPFLAPNYSFGIASRVQALSQADSTQLVQQIRAQFHDP